MNVTQPNPRTMRSRMKDFLLYCGIGVLVAATAILAGIHQARTGVRSEATAKWLGFVIMTALVFGNAVRYFRSSWSSPKFWGLLILFSVPHFILGFVVLSNVARLGLIQFAVVTPVEYFVLDTFLRRFSR
jgi:hypothetical protein